jgi:hypothetical protein
VRAAHDAGSAHSYAHVRASLQAQPAQRGRSKIQHLRRFISTRSGRKAQYARALVLALDLDRMPRPLDALLGW